MMYYTKQSQDEMKLNASKEEMEIKHTYLN